MEKKITQSKKNNTKLINYFSKKGKMSFLQRDYFGAMEAYSYAFERALAKQANPSKQIQNSCNKAIKDIQTLIKLCDLALDHEDEARALFEYYEVLKTQKSSNPHLVIDELLSNLDENLNKMTEVLSYFSANNTDYLDGVTLKDFRSVSSKIGFKKAFETLMFSSRIILQSREEFLSFMKDLIQHDFLKIALVYFENAPASTLLDNEFVTLYQKLLKKLSQQSRCDDNSF